MNGGLMVGRPLLSTHSVPELHLTPIQCAPAAAMPPSSAVAMAAVSMASWSVMTRQTALMAPMRPPVKNVSWGTGDGEARGTLTALLMPLGSHAWP